MLFRSFDPRVTIHDPRVFRLESGPTNQRGNSIIYHSKDSVRYGYPSLKVCASICKDDARTCTLIRVEVLRISIERSFRMSLPD